MLMAPSGCTDHAAIKADRARWCAEMRNHRAWHVVGVELAEHPPCCSTLSVPLGQGVLPAPVGDGSVLDWSATAQPKTAAAAAEVCA